MMKFLEQGLQHRDKEAVADSEGGWTYRQLRYHSESVAGQLTGAPGWRRGERVGLLLPRRKESVATLLGVMGAGGIAVPFPVRTSGREIAHEIIDAGISWIISNDMQHAALQDALTILPSPTNVPRVFDCGISRSVSAAGGTFVESSPDDPALIIYTSGTTGAAKGVVHTQATLLAQVDVLHRAWEWSAQDRLLHVLPLHHVHGLVNGLLGALYAGASLQFLDSFDASNVWDRFASGKVSVFYAVPTIYHQLLEEWQRHDFPTQNRWAAGAGKLRLTVSGSAALPVSIWNRWSQITGQTLLERYGMTEIGMAISNPLCGERRAGTVGQPLPGMRVRIVTESGEDAAEGVPGEIYVQGPSVFQEYWGKPDFTRAAFRDGYFLTGDIAETRDGYVRILGRASMDILKSAGYKLSALEIEETLREHPAVRDVAVVGVPDSEWGEIVTACVVVHAGRSLSLDQVRGWCQDKLAPYKVPRRLDVRAELPRNAMGKVTKHELIRELTSSS